MEEIKCSCGGMFQYLGPEFLRTGNIQFLVDKDVEEKCIPGELYVCDRCRCLRFCANAIWISERKAWWEEQRAEVEREQQRQQANFQARFQAFLLDFAAYSSQKLEKIASGGSLFSGYDEVAQAAARHLLEERKANPDAAPREQEHVQPEPRPQLDQTQKFQAPLGAVIFCDRQKIPGTSWLQEFFTERTGPGQMPGALMRSIYLYSSTSSAQAADHSLPRPRESSLPPLRLLSHPQPLRSTGDGAPPSGARSGP